MDRQIKIMDKYLSVRRKRVLTLTVSKEWFDMIVSGEKNEEYRVIKDFWMSRLLLIKDEEFKDFDKYDKLHIGKTFEMLIDTNTIISNHSLLTARVRTFFFASDKYLSITLVNLSIS